MTKLFISAYLASCLVRITHFSPANACRYIAAFQNELDINVQSIKFNASSDRFTILLSLLNRVLFSRFTTHISIFIDVQSSVAVSRCLFSQFTHVCHHHQFSIRYHRTTFILIILFYKGCIWPSLYKRANAVFVVYLLLVVWYNASMAAPGKPYSKVNKSRWTSLSTYCVRVACCTRSSRNVGWVQVEFMY